MNGQTWFVAKDVCKVLGISNHKDAVSRLDDDEMRGVGITDLIGRTQRMSAVSESGLYHLVFQSRKPEARKFRRWVTGEVLPQIRMTGGYRADLRRDESPAGAAGCDRGATGASAPGGLLLRGRVYPKDRSAELGAFYAELRKWVLKEDEAAVAELAGVSPGHVVRSAARRAEQVEELRLDFMCGVAGCDRGAMGASADKLTSKHVGTEADMRPAGAGDQGAQAAGSACPEVVLRPEGRRTAGSHETGQDVTDGIIDFNGMEG